MKHSIIQIALMMVATVLFYGCSASIQEPANTLSGTFNGATAEEDLPISLTVVKSSRGFYGVGTYDGSPLILSLMSSYRGIGEMTYNGKTTPVTAELSFDGTDLVLAGMESPALLHRNGAAEAPARGPFSGRYQSGEMAETGAAIDFHQSENLVAGTGVVYNKKFIISGLADAENNFEGRALFTDGSEVAVTAKLSRTGRSLTLVGLAGTLEFTRL